MKAANLISDREQTSKRCINVTLLGTGNVGKAVLQRLAQWDDNGFEHGLKITHVANSRVALASGEGVVAGDAKGFFEAYQTGDDLSQRRASLNCDVKKPTLDITNTNEPHIVIDATASEAVTARHATWLGDGVHVVTACKLGQGTELSKWKSVQSGRQFAQYGDSATVGAGLPLLRSIRELRQGGDRVTGIAGVLSGTLAWLFNHYDGMRPFSDLVRQAREAGYTEPDPRDDLCGEDVKRKILILARAAGVEIDADDVEVTSLVPEELQAIASSDVDANLSLLDTPLRERFAAAYKNREKLIFVAELKLVDGRYRATVGLQSLPLDHPLVGGSGTDNKVAIWSDRYNAQPLVIQGPGAGAEVTAAGLLDDALRIARSL